MSLIPSKGPVDRLAICMETAVRPLASLSRDTLTDLLPKLAKRRAAILDQLASTKMIAYEESFAYALLGITTA